MTIQIFPVRLLALVEPVKFRKNLTKKQLCEIIDIFSEEFDCDTRIMKRNYLLGIVSNVYVYNRLERMYYRKKDYTAVNGKLDKSEFKQYMLDKQAWIDYRIRNELGDENENQSASTNTE